MLKNAVSPGLGIDMFPNGCLHVKYFSKTITLMMWYTSY